MIKKIFEVLLIACMLTASLAGCGQKTETADIGAKASGKKTIIGYLGSDTGSADNVIFANSTRALCDLVGYTMSFTPDLTYDADSCISFVENQISAGAKGLVLCPPSDSVLLTVMNLCEEAGVYWGITTRSIADEAVREKVEASQYYVGNCYEDEYNLGYEVMRRMNDMGYKKIAIISTAKGNTTCDAREEAIAQACKDFGMEVIAEARDFTQASEVMVASESFLASYQDLDAIFIVGTYAVGAPSAAVKAIQDSGRGDDVKLTAIDYGLTEGIVSCFESGVLTLDVIGMQYDPFCVVAKVINAVNETPISDKSFETLLKMDYITDVETAAKWEEKYSDESTLYMTEEEMKRLLNTTNPDLTVETYDQYVNAWDPVG